MLLNCGVGEDSWEPLGLQGDPTSPSERKSVLNIHWKDWCWSWNYSTLTSWCKELTHWKRPWFWERLKAGEGDDRGWDGWMASPTPWTWVWVNSGSYREAWHAAVHGVTKSQTQLGNWTELNWRYKAEELWAWSWEVVCLSLLGPYLCRSTSPWPKHSWALPSLKLEGYDCKLWHTLCIPHGLVIKSDKIYWKIKKKRYWRYFEKVKCLIQVKCYWVGQTVCSIFCTVLQPTPYFTPAIWVNWNKGEKANLPPEALAAWEATIAPLWALVSFAPWRRL